MTKERTYQINEVFYSLQGEGLRAGTANVFVRFSGCNLSCDIDNEAGFRCDTEFVSGRRFALAELYVEIRAAIQREGGTPYDAWLILTGGEPGLQVDAAFVEWAHGCGFKLAIETNGTQELPDGIDWTCCSPKSAEHTLRLKHADELKYVRNVGQGVPRPSIAYEHGLISPAFRTLLGPGDVPRHEPEPGALAWCIGLVKENPTWRLSVQQHKLWNVR